MGITKEGHKNSYILKVTKTTEVEIVGLCIYLLCKDKKKGAFIVKVKFEQKNYQ